MSVINKNYYTKNISAVVDILTASVARVWTPWVSPRRSHKFHGEFFHGGRNVRDTVTPLVVAGRGDRQTNRQTDKQINRRTLPQHKGTLRRGINRRYGNHFIFGTPYRPMIEYTCKLQPPCTVHTFLDEKRKLALNNQSEKGVAYCLHFITETKTCWRATSVREKWYIQISNVALCSCLRLLCRGC